MTLRISAKPARKSDLVVNTAHHRDLSPERTVLRQGGTLINLTDFTQAQRAQLAGEGAEGRGLVVADTGFSGIAYLAIAEMLREHPEADAAEYTLMFSAERLVWSGWSALCPQPADRFVAPRDHDDSVPRAVR